MREVIVQALEAWLEREHPGATLQMMGSAEDSRG